MVSWSLTASRTPSSDMIYHVLVPTVGRELPGNQKRDTSGVRTRQRPMIRCGLKELGSDIDVLVMAA